MPYFQDCADLAFFRRFVGAIFITPNSPLLLVADEHEPIRAQCTAANCLDQLCAQRTCVGKGTSLPWHRSEPMRSYRRVLSSLSSYDNFAEPVFF